MILITALLQRIQKDIPVEWDRYTESNGYYNIYGWIKRKDGQRDFVLIQALVLHNQIAEYEFVTSSAKYSKQLMEIIIGTSENHVSCKKISELYE